MSENYGYPGAFVTLWEDFVTDNVTDWVETVSSATMNIADRHGGWWRMPAGGNDTDDMDMAAEVVWEVDEGQALLFETRVEASAITGIGIFAGMCEANTYGSGVNPIEDEAGALATAAVDAVGFILDESSAGTQDTTWQAVGVQNNTDNAQISLTDGAAIVAATPQVLRMELNVNDSGTARYFIGTAEEMGGGVLVSTQTSWFRSSVQLAPMIGADDRAVATNVDWDYVFVSAPRT